MIQDLMTTMSRQIIIQPDGKLAVWSTGVDDFVIVDADDEELVKYYAEKAYQQAANETADTIAQLRNGDNVLYQFQLTWEKANKIRKEVHGE